MGDRLSLAGMQTKFSLANVGGNWYKSTALLPSTHIFKPGGVDYVENIEAGAQALARHIGIRAAEGTVVVFGNQTTYATKRFDRTYTPKGIVRNYQEDIAQVLGITKDNKYGATFKTIVETLKTYGMPEDEIYVLVQYMIYNVHVGNTDAHGKNYSVTYYNGTLSMAPLYDCVPGLGYRGKYSKTGLSMPVNGKRDPRKVTLEDWMHWSISNNLSWPRVEYLVRHTVSRIYEQAPGVLREFHVPDYHIQGVYLHLAEFLSRICRRAGFMCYSSTQFGPLVQKVRTPVS